LQIYTGGTSGGIDYLYCRLATSPTVACTGWAAGGASDALTGLITSIPVANAWAAAGYVLATTEGGKVYKINMGDGTVAAEYPDPLAVPATIGIITASPNLMRHYTTSPAVYFGSHDGTFYTLDPQTMTELWTYTPAVAGKFESTAYTTAALTTDIYSARNEGATYDQGIIHKITKAGAGSSLGTSVGKITTLQIYYNGNVYFGSEDGRVYCIDASTGAEVWRFATGGPITGSPTFRGGNLTIGSKYGKVYQFSP
jgi:outer membrane protein assembly factor BamB